MADTRSTCLRFNLDKEDYRKAWNVLQKSDKSYSKTIIEALNEYDDRHSRLTDDPFFESREREEKFVEQIVTAVESALDKALPTFFSATFFKMMQPYGTAAPPATSTVDELPKKFKEISADDVDWDFLGG